MKELQYRLVSPSLIRWSPHHHFATSSRFVCFSFDKWLSASILGDLTTPPDSVRRFEAGTN